MKQPSLFDAIQASLPPAQREYADYRVPAFPLIASKGITQIVANFETNGLEWWGGAQPIAIATRLPDGTCTYNSWGHRGGNSDEETAKRWASRELRDVHITNSNTKFDVHMAHAWGIDLEAQNCTVSDVGHYAALLDDHRFTFGLDHLIRDLLHEEPMPRLDESRMPSYHAAQAAPRALYNVEMVQRLRDVMWPRLDAEDLQRVRALEDRVIFPVCEMERNGALIDAELLDRWVRVSEITYKKLLYDLAVMVGFQVHPGERKSLLRLWDWVNKQLRPTGRTLLVIETLASGAPSFTDAILKDAEAAHPALKLLRYALKLKSLRSKYLLKYQRTVDRHGRVRYALHQLRTQKDELSDRGDAGTISGRFSSSELAEGVGLNIQQVMKASKQRVAFGYDEEDSSHDDEIFVIRTLHVPPSGRRFLSADAMQIEYRLFVSYSGNQRVIDAYKADPMMSFHRYMHSRILPFKPDQTYRQQKDLNFAYVYGAGMTKQALMLNHISQAEFEEIRRSKNYRHPKLLQTQEVRRIYDAELPEVKGLLERASFIAKPACDAECYTQGGSLTALHSTEEHRGYVRTILGRRSRFPKGQRLHKAFNAVDQGSAADIMKQKTVELHDARKETGLTLRYIVHDEVDGDCEDDEAARRVAAILNRQTFEGALAVPILWEVSTGRNWAAVKTVPHGIS